MYLNAFLAKVMEPFARKNSTVVLSDALVAIFSLARFGPGVLGFCREFVSPHLEARHVVHVHGDDHHYYYDYD
jgi:hypothetical protein